MVVCAAPARVAAAAIPAYIDGVPVQKLVKVSNKVEAPTPVSKSDICDSRPLISSCITRISCCNVVISPCNSSMGTHSPVAAEVTPFTEGVTAAAYLSLVRTSLSTLPT